MAIQDMPGEELNTNFPVRSKWVASSDQEDKENRPPGDEKPKPNAKKLFGFKKAPPESGHNDINNRRGSPMYDPQILH